MVKDERTNMSEIYPLKLGLGEAGLTAKLLWDHGQG